VPASLAFVVPACNAAATLADTLRSIQAQSRGDWQAVVVDDGSRDATSAIARPFLADPRLRLVSQENRGLAAARNRGIAETVTPFLCFLDADDVVSPIFAQRMLAAIGGCDLAACCYRMVGPDLNDLDWIIHPGDHDLAPERLIHYNPLAVGAVVVRRAAAGLSACRVATSNGPGLFNPALPVHEDWDAWLRLTAAGASWAPIVPEALFSYRLRPGSISDDLERMWRIGLEVIASAPVPDDLKPAAIRAWTVRHVAHAAARGNAALVNRWRSALGPLRSTETDLLAGTLRWALCRQEHIGPSSVDEPRAALWQRRLAAILGAAAEPIAPRPCSWAAVVRRLEKELADKGRIVIYGVGRNGRELLAELEEAALPHPVAWIDDHPAASPPRLHRRVLPRLSVADLTPRDVVVVTPDSRDAIVERLRSRGVERLITIAGEVPALHAEHT
jgi:hypothetical protein